MNNPDSAMAAAREMHGDCLECDLSDNGCHQLQKEAAIIRTHQAQEIGELVEALRELVDNSEYQRGTTYEISTRWVEKAESLLSRYPKV